MHTSSGYGPVVVMVTGASKLSVLRPSGRLRSRVTRSISCFRLRKAINHFDSRSLFRPPVLLRVFDGDVPFGFSPLILPGGGSER